MINNITIVFIFSILLTGCEKIKDILKKETEQKCFEQSKIGIYQIVLGTIGMKQTYMIDTKKGRIWVKDIMLLKFPLGKAIFALLHSTPNLQNHF